MKFKILLLFLSVISADCISQIRYDRAYGINVYAWSELYDRFDATNHTKNLKHRDGKLRIPENKSAWIAGWNPGIGISCQYSDYLPALRFENLYRIRSFEAAAILNQYSTFQFNHWRQAPDTTFISDFYFTEERQELAFGYIQEIHNKGRKHAGVFIGLGFALNQGIYRTGHYLEENYYMYRDKSLPSYYDWKRASQPGYEADYKMRSYTTAKLFIPLGFEFFGLKQSKFRFEFRPGFGYEYGWGGTVSKRIQFPIGFGFYYVSGLKRGRVI